ncbi:hypothetical protein [Leadbettera azotonutricia]|uniref:hypothetical protein n=1 Tax=Leadbettera azotonutricia TaxID=150829 RepID=UPI0011D2A265|nr:hypothetical protein [Leadbettera azotonutricia]
MDIPVFHSRVYGELANPEYEFFPFARTFTGVAENVSIGPNGSPFIEVSFTLSETMIMAPYAAPNNSGGYHLVFGIADDLVDAEWFDGANTIESFAMDVYHDFDFDPYGRLFTHYDGGSPVFDHTLRRLGGFADIPGVGVEPLVYAQTMDTTSYDDMRNGALTFDAYTGRLYFTSGAGISYIDTESPNAVPHQFDILNMPENYSLSKRINALAADPETGDLYTVLRDRKYDNGTQEFLDHWNIARVTSEGRVDGSPVPLDNFIFGNLRDLSTIDSIKLKVLNNDLWVLYGDYGVLEDPGFSGVSIIPLARFSSADVFIEKQTLDAYCPWGILGWKEDTLYVLAFNWFRPDPDDDVYSNDVYILEIKKGASVIAFRPSGLLPGSAQLINDPLPSPAQSGYWEGVLKSVKEADDD